MDESSNQTTKKSKSSDSIITAINMIAMGAGIAAAIIAANKSKTASKDASRIEKSVSELNAKFDKISDQLKTIQQPAKVDDPVSSSKKADGVAQQQQQQPKPQQDVIYVKKSSEFSFYN